MAVKQSIGNNVKTFRKRLGISQDTLSKRANLALLTVFKIESGSTANPSVQTIKKIADALEVPVDKLIG